MSDSGKAVFLSYASQDAEAAKRIANALRAAGVEVWFDQSELVGGDQWDAKIRGQISSCALFMPVISANTQARKEGYFRIEWRLAAQRTHAMSDDSSFLMPVVVDDTKDAEARVPAEFKAVQWTKLPGGEATPAFVHRVGKILGPEVATVSDKAFSSPVSMTGQGRPQPGMLTPSKIGVGVLVLVVVAGSVWLALRRPATGDDPATAGSTRAAVSPARALVEKARPLVSEINASRAKLDAAAELLAQAVALDPQDATAWGLWSQLDSHYCRWGMDYSKTRSEEARRKATRSLVLEPQGRDGLLGQAMALMFSGTNTTFLEAESVLQQLLKLFPDDAEALVRLGEVARWRDRKDEAITYAERAAKLPGRFVLGAENLGLSQYRLGDSAAALATFDRVLSRGPSWQSLRLKGLIESEWTGNLDAAAEAMAKLPSDVLLEDFAASVAFQIHRFRREHDRSIELLRLLPTDEIGSNILKGPRNLYLGDALLMSERGAAAAVAWTEALQLVEKSLGDKTGDRIQRYWRAALLARLGRKEEAAKEYQIVEQLFNGQAPRPTSWTFTLRDLGRTEEALGYLEKSLADRRVTAAALRFEPYYDPFRAMPRFQALLAKAESDPGAGPVKSRPPGAAADADKSVAVLAFANLSDDKANEYFSDGISEELLNVLAKVPGLKVSARTSAFHFKGKDTPISEIARQLGVAYVVEGSVRKAGDKVRITAQLIKAADGFHVWSDTFTRDLKDIFAVQDEIAGKVAKSLTDKLGMNMPASTSTNIDAYNVYLQARSNLANRTIGSLRLAVEQFETALKLDPAYAPARAGLAKSLMLIPMFTRSYQAAMNRELIDRCLREAEAVIATNPENAEAWIVLGFVEANYNWRWKRVIEAVEKALALAPNDAEVVNFAGDCLRIVRDRRRMLEVERRALDLNPLGSFNHWDLAFANISDRNFELAARHAREALAMKADSVEACFTLIWSLGKLRRFDEMRAALAGANRDVKEADAVRLNLAVNAAVLEGRMDEARRLLEQNAPSAEQGLISPAERSFLYLLIGEPDQAAYWLKRAIANRDVNLVYEEPIELARFAAEPKTRFILEVPEIRELLEIRERFSREAGK